MGEFIDELRKKNSMFTSQSFYVPFSPRGHFSRQEVHLPLVEHPSTRWETNKVHWTLQGFAFLKDLGHMKGGLARFKFNCRSLIIKMQHF